MRIKGKSKITNTCKNVDSLLAQSYFIGEWYKDKVVFLVYTQIELNDNIKTII